MLSSITDVDFNDKVLNSSNPVLVDFWAPWCGPCKMLAPTLERVAQNFEGKVDVLKVNVDENPEASAKYGITNIPTLILFKEGQPIGKITGLRPIAEIENAIKNALNI